MVNLNTARPVIVFVHGFGSCDRCWTRAGHAPGGWNFRSKSGPLIGDLAASDPALSGWDVDYFVYSTRWFNFNPLRRIPPISQVGEQLKTWLQAKRYHKRPTTLVGHSQGGLVILSYLTIMLENKEASLLDHVRQVILIATPQKGSTLFYSTRRVLGTFFENVQEKRLRVLNDSVDKLLATITRDVINADRQSESEWPLSIRAFYGTDDGVVLRESARGELDPGAIDSVPGDHFSVLKPKNSDDSRYSAIRESILQPIGHKRVFQIERYNTEIVVAPASREEDIVFNNRKEHLKVRSVGQINRLVQFADTNLCEERFLIRYRTRAPDGYLKYTSSVGEEGNGITSAVEQDYRDNGNQIRFSMRPSRRKHDQCYLNVDVINGFNPGNTTAHFHLRPPDEPLRSIAFLSYLVDLSAYMSAGMTLSQPELYLQSRDPAACDDLCKSRRPEERHEPVLADPIHGIWKWTLLGVTGGVVSISWDIKGG